MTSKSVDERVEEFWRGYAGQKLEKTLPALSEVRMWKILGEDPNCDFGGNHHEPVLGYVAGTVQEVLRLAVQHPSFYQWGRGGRLEPFEVLTVEQFQGVLNALQRSHR